MRWVGLVLSGALVIPAPVPAEEADGEEAKAIYDVDFAFVGNQEVSARSLRNGLVALRADLRRQGVSPGDADDAAYEVERYYHSQGYRAATVSAVSRAVDGGFIITIQIEEGPRSFVERIGWAGNLLFQSEELEDCFAWVRSGVTPLGRMVLGEPVFTDAVLADGLSCIEARYELEGHLFARASARRVNEDTAGRVEIDIEVEEGPRMTFTEARIEGVQSFPLAEVRKALDVTPGEVFVPRLPLVLKGKVVDFYMNRGHRWVEVEAARELDRERGEGRVLIKVDEGPLARIEEIQLHGNEKTLDSVLLGRLKFATGELYSEEEVRESYHSLLRSGLFSSLKIETEPIEGARERLRLHITVSEKAKYKLGVLGGWGSYELLRGAIVLENTNVLGTGHRARIEGKGSLRGEGVSGEYVIPYFLDERLSQSTKGFWESREQPSFTEDQFGAESGFSFRASDNLRTNLYYRLRESNVVDVDAGVPPELIQDVLLSSVVFSSVLDFRNSIVDPDRGSTHRVSLEYGGTPIGSEIDFTRVTATTSWVFPLTGGLRVVAAARAGVIAPFADTQVIPIQERFFLGGESTIRSYRQDEAGPLVNNDPIGGEAFSVYNLELRFPLLVLEDLQGAAFFDTGTVNEEIQDFGGGRYFFGVGLGIRYNTPFGPFRFDAAHNPDREPGEDSFVFHVGLGYPF
jgi:outer membrane protein assembly complex protein YaeT